MPLHSSYNTSAELHPPAEAASGNKFLATPADGSSGDYVGRVIELADLVSLIAPKVVVTTANSLGLDPAVHRTIIAGTPFAGTVDLLLPQATTAMEFRVRNINTGNPCAVTPYLGDLLENSGADYS